MNWFYGSSDAAKGPFSADEIAQLFRDGVLSAATPLWRQTLPDWGRLDAQPEFAGLVSSPAADMADIQPVLPELRLAGPWTRLFARVVDNCIILAITAVLAIALLIINPALVKPRTISIYLFFSTILGLLLQLATLAAFGNSAGKMLLGIMAVPADGRTELTTGGLMARELRVFVFGMGLGLPVISFVTALVAWWKLSTRGTTGYDANRARVINVSASGARNFAVLAACLIEVMLMLWLFGFGYNIYVQSLV